MDKVNWQGKGSDSRVSDHKAFSDNSDNVKKVREFDTSSFKMTVNGKEVDESTPIKSPANTSP
jgi:hypothetical protein